MRDPPLIASLESVRRLTVAKQHLAGPQPSRATSRAIVSMLRDVAYIQWDPVSIVAPSHLISLWSRVGDVRPATLDRLLWREKTLFLHWTPIASLVLTEDFPLYRSLMRRYPASLGRSWNSQRVAARRFLATHAELRREVLRELGNGPLTLGQFEAHVRTRRNDSDWTPASDVSLLLYHLLMGGEVMVVGHEGNQNLWGLAEPFLPTGVDRTELTDAEYERAASQRALRALGTATPREIKFHFPRGRYDRLGSTLAALEDESLIHRVMLEGSPDREPRYIHDRDVPRLESMSTSAWQPRTSLLPPFDNLLGNTQQIDRLFGFHYIREQFLPKEKRRYGTYVLPILSGERFVGRIDPRLDKTTGTLVVQAVHAEPDAADDRDVAVEVAETVARFGEFLRASRVTYSSRVPPNWKRALR